MINKSQLIKSTTSCPYYTPDKHLLADIDYSITFPGCNYKCTVFIDVSVQGLIISAKYYFIGDFVLKYLLHNFCRKLYNRTIDDLPDIYEEVLTNIPEYLDTETFNYIQDKRGYKTFNLLGKQLHD